MKSTIQNQQTKFNLNLLKEYLFTTTTSNPLNTGSKIVLGKILKIAIGIMILTVVHHAYGAIIYEAPFRLHVTFIAIPVIAVLYLTYKLFLKYPQKKIGKIGLWAFLIIAIIFPFGSIALYEGGYNHLLKNILYFANTSQDTLNHMFPAPTYEMPNDFWFEFSGILQFVYLLYAIYYLRMVLKKN